MNIAVAISDAPRTSITTKPAGPIAYGLDTPAIHWDDSMMSVDDGYYLPNNPKLSMYFRRRDECAKTDRYLSARLYHSRASVRYNASLCEMVEDVHCGTHTFNKVILHQSSEG